MKSCALLLIAALTMVAGNAMSQPAAPTGQEQTRQPDADPKVQPSLTPAQLIAQDFQSLARDHATVGVANPKPDGAQSR